MTPKLKVIALLVAFLAVVGCRSGYPVYTVDSLAFRIAEPAPLEKIENAIVDAGVRRGWKMKKIRPGLVEGTYTRSGAIAVVDITFTAKHYSITHKNSQNLSYDGARISNHYNSWVKSLSSDIYREVWSING